MPVYNAQKYVGAAIESILRQTYTDFEFIIIDDCSIDASFAVLEEYKVKDVRIRLFKNPVNYKLAKTLNLGISYALGKYIVRMDADDIAVSTKFAQQLAFMEHNLHIGVCGTWCATFFDDVNHPFGMFRFAINPEMVKVKMYLFKNELAHPTVMIRKSILDNGFSYNEKPDNYAEDWALWLDMLDQGVQISNLPETLLYYRYSHAQITNKDNAKIAYARYQILVKGLKRLFKTNLTQEIIDTHINFLLEPKTIGSVLKLGTYYKHLQLLKDTNRKNHVFDIKTFDYVIDQYLLRNKIKQKIKNLFE